MATSQGQAATRVFLAGMHVVLTQENEELVRIPVPEIKLIGEYTTSAGPFVDDWFIVFMTSEKNWKQISEYTPGMLEMLQELSSHLKAETIGSLAASTSWRTNIIWPQRVAGQEMWNVVSERPITLLEKLKKSMGFADQQLVLTEAAASVFR
ncbi:MAG TPA: hypothetical protein VF690_08515 [Hymenobacter sp.]|jgi:hypothetical protein